MKKRLWHFSTLILFANSSFAEELTPSEIFDGAAPSIVVIYGLDADGKKLIQGSGVVISPQVIVSNCHVLKSAKSAQVIYRGRSYDATLRNGDLAMDVCALHVPQLLAPSVTVGVAQGHRIGSQVFAIGAPLGLELSISDGLLSGYRTVPSGEVLQITAPISPGSSGGGLFDSKGRLIGITTSTSQKGQQINFAVPIDWAIEVVARTPLRAPENPISSKGIDHPSSTQQEQMGTVADGRWVLVSEDDRSKVFFDLETMEVSGASRVVWQRHIYKFPQSHLDFKNVSEVRIRWRYHCKDGYGDLGAYQIYEGGVMVDQKTTSEFPERTVLPPESAGEKLLQYVCGAS